MRGTHYSSRTIKVGNPFIPYGVTMMLVGLVGVVLAISSLVEIQQSLKTLFSSPDEADARVYLTYSPRLKSGAFFWILCNLVVRSDANVKIYSGSAITENYQLTGERQIISMISDDAASEAAQIVVASLREFESEGVVVRGIDVGARSMENIAKANLAYNEAKRAIDVSEAPVQIEAQEQKRLTENPSEILESESMVDTTIAKESKTCPECAEDVKAEARKCRYCGYRFDEVVSE